MTSPLVDLDHSVVPRPCPDQPRATGDRSADIHHYNVERELADKLRSASSAERATLYGEVYDELFRRVPDHVQLTSANADVRATKIAQKRRLVDRFLSSSKTFLEVGAGDCAFIADIAPDVQTAIAVDVSETVTSLTDLPSNARLVLSDGTSIPVPAGSVDVVYSDQLMEHLHPDDALEQLTNLRAAIAPGGRYVCMTPSRLTGPHDISRDFDDEATGFHLREYTVRELAAYFRKAGFDSVDVYAGGQGTYVRIPYKVAATTEWLFELLPRAIRRSARNLAPIKALFGANVVGRVLA